MIYKSFKIKKTRRRQLKKEDDLKNTFFWKTQERYKGTHHADVLGVKFNNKTIEIYL